VIATPPAVHHVVQVDRTWTCRSPVDLDLDQGDDHAKVIGDRRNKDAVHLRPGLRTGRIGRLLIVQWVGDGVKVARGAHDLTVGGGSIRCPGKAPRLHQDGIQVLGGMADHLREPEGELWPPSSRLINSNFFVNQAGHSSLPPRDRLRRLLLGGWAAHGERAALGALRRAALDDLHCPVPAADREARARRARPGAPAQQDPPGGPGQLTLDPGPLVGTFGKRLVLTGLFLGQRPGSLVAAEARKLGAPRFVRAGRTHSRRNGRFRPVLRPRIGETVRLHSGLIRGPVTIVP
jgi:hypothetical protein